MAMNYTICVILMIKLNVYFLTEVCAQNSGSWSPLCNPIKQILESPLVLFHVKASYLSVK